MAELRKEYADIVCREVSKWANGDIATVESLEAVALACQALADRPPRELSDAEVDKLLHDTRHMDTKSTFRFIEAAIHAKQREPEVVKFRAAVGAGSDIVMLRGDRPLPSLAYKWLEPAQEFEVKLP